MKNTDVERILADLDDMLSMKKTTLRPLNVGDQFIYVAFQMLTPDNQIKMLSLYEVINLITRDSPNMALVRPGLNIGEITEKPSMEGEGIIKGKVAEMLTAKLSRPYNSPPVIDDNTTPDGFSWTVTVDRPDIFKEIFPNSTAINTKVYDLVYVLYQLAKYNEMLGLYGSSVVAQLKTLLSQSSVFDIVIYDKLLGLSNSINTPPGVRH